MLQQFIKFTFILTLPIHYIYLLCRNYLVWTFLLYCRLKNFSHMYVQSVHCTDSLEHGESKYKEPQINKLSRP